MYSTVMAQQKGTYAFLTHRTNCTSIVTIVPKVYLIRNQFSPKTSFVFFIFFAISFFLLGLICSSLVVAAPPNKQFPRQVLIVHSAYEGYPWTDSLNRGIHQVFDSVPESIEFLIEYIDTKRNHGKFYFEELQKLWQIKYRNRKIDLILVCDNEAYDFIVKDRDTLFQNIPVVFVAFIGFNPSMLMGKKQITGVVQETDVQATIDVALKLHPQTKKIVFVAPGAPSFRMVWLKDLPARYKGRVELMNITANDLAVVDKALASLGPDSIVIPLNSLVDEYGTYMPFDQFVSHVATNAVFPVYALWDIALNHEVVGGKMVTGEMQGREASKLALKILRGTPVSELPVIKNSPNQYMFDWRLLKRFDIRLDDLPREAVVINRPVSFYTENKTIVHTTLLGLSVLVLLVVLLIATIANLKRAQKKLLLSDEILKQMPEAIVLTDSHGNIERWLGKAEQILGYSAKESLHRSIDFIQPSQIHPTTTTQLMDSIEKNGEFLGELLCQRKDGTKIPVETIATRIFDKHGTSIGIIGILKDITERKEAENALKKSEARFKKMIKKSPLPMVITDQNQDIDFFNDKFTELFGYTREDISTAEQWWSTVYPDINYRTKVQNTWIVAIEDAIQNDTDVIMQEWNLTIKDGRVRQCEFYMLPLQEVSLIIMNDISQRKQDEVERKKLERRLQQAQKMEAIGTLAGGIAHDFNNILGVILGYSELAREDSPSGSIVISHLDQVIQGGNKAKELVKQILSFSRQEELERVPLTLNIPLLETLKMLRASIPTTIEIQNHIDPTCGFVLANPTQIHQIIMNLCTNASQEMEGTGGVLNIELKKTFIHRGNKHIYPTLGMGEYVQLTVSDTGNGIAPDDINKIFEPYFTTKKVGKGTGMGLATIHGIINDYGGLITVESQLGQGSTFHVFFPVIESDRIEVEVSPHKIPCGNERILLVDDEAILVKLGKKILERLGYNVTIQSSSIEALSIFKKNPDLFDIIVTDQTMPGMTGSDLATEILRIRPDIPIILCTGYSNQIDKDTAISMGIKGFALKPLNKYTIANLIRNVMDSNALL